MNEAADHHLKQARIALTKAHMHLATARDAGALPADEIADMALTVNEFRDRLKEITREAS